MPEKIPQLLHGLVFCITGEFGEDRDSIIKKLMSMGARPTTSVTKVTNCLIIGEEPGEVKQRKAREYGIRTVGREWLINTLRKGGLELRPRPKIEVEDV